MKLDPFSDIKLDRQNLISAGLILLLGLIITSFATYFVHKKNNNEDHLKFNFQKNSFLRKLDSRMESYENALIQTRAFIMNSPGIKLKELKGYINDTELFERFPGLQGLGYAMVVPPKHIISKNNPLLFTFPEYKVWPKGVRDFYTSIIVLVPEDSRNKRAIGFDMYSDPVRREAMKRAKDENKTIMSKKVVLVQEDKNESYPGFLIYLPHFHNKMKIGSLEDRRKAIVGYVYTPFRAGELFKAILSELKIDLNIEIYDGIEVSKETNLFNSSDVNFEDAKRHLRSKEEIEINGRTWTIRFSALPSFNSTSSIFKDLIIFISGLILSLLLTWIFLISRKQTIAVMEMAEEKEKLLKKEKAHVAARDDFLSIASHELKTPLTSLKLQSQVMMRSIKRNDPDALSHEKVTTLIRQIDTQTTRLTRLVDDMLDISRIRTGRLKMEMDDVDVCELVNDVIERLMPQFQKVIGKAPEVSISQGLTARWDRFRIEQVLNNLLTNAIRYGNGKPVKISVERNENQIDISVIDQGIGIAPENLDKIFDRFERAGMSASEVSGLGLGLFITKQIVVAHHGQISVESSPGKGSTFKVTLPISSSEKNA